MLYSSISIEFIKEAVNRCPHNQSLPWLRICCNQHYSQIEKLEPNEINFNQGFSQKVVSTSYAFNSLPARGDFCCLLIIFANSLDPDQAQHNTGPDLDPNCLTPEWY